MVSSLEAARAAAKQAIETLYHEGTCSIVEYQDVTNPTTKITRQEAVTVATNIPCKLSFESLNAVV